MNFEAQPKRDSLRSLEHTHPAVITQETRATQDLPTPRYTIDKENRSPFETRKISLLLMSLRVQARVGESGISFQDIRVQ